MRVRVLLSVLLATCWVAPCLAHPDDADVASVMLELVDSASGEPVAGVVQFRTTDEQLVRPSGLLDRGLGVGAKAPIHDWSVVAGPVRVKLPRQKLAITAFSGLETETAHTTVDLSRTKSAHLRIPLTRFFDAAAAGYRNANTHVHLRKISRGQSDRYLLEVARADGLDIVFVSYLERAVDDLEYTSNKYTRGQLEKLSNDHVHFGHGEEHRHNFTPYDEGYGHVMLLDIPQLIHPVSIGPGITKEGTDDIPLRRGIEQARGLGGKVIWCHNAWGLEDIPNWLAGRLHANNIFDGGTHGSYQHSFYRYLNTGIRVPFSTGTDWFIYDFSRVYVPGGPQMTVRQWLDQLALGRSYITNGPLLEFSVEQQQLGGTVDLPEPAEVRVQGRARGRLDFQRIELICNGQVKHFKKSRKVGDHYEAQLDLMVDIREPSWLALRTPPPSAPQVPELQQKTPLNEFGKELFSHTSATFVDVAGERIFRRSAAEQLLADMQRSRAKIAETGRFDSQQSKQQVLFEYDQAIEKCKSRILNRHR